MQETTASGNLLRKLSLGSIGAFSVKVGGALLALLTQLLLARLLDAEHFGIYRYVLTWVLVLALIAKLGTDTMQVRYVSSYQARKEWGRLRGVIISSNLAIALLSLLIVAFGFLALMSMEHLLSAALLETFRAGLLAVPLLALLDSQLSSLRALGRAVRSCLPRDVLRYVIFIAIILGAWKLTGIALDAACTMLLYLVALAATLLIALLWLLAELRPLEAGRPDYSGFREWLSVSLPMLLVAGLIMVNHRTDILMLGMLRDTTDAGIYSVSASLAELLSWGLVSVNVLLAPMISQLHTLKKHRELQGLLSQAIVPVAGFGVLAALALLCAGEAILGLFGRAFTAGYSALLILTTGQMINCLAGPVGYIAMMTAYQRVVAHVTALTAILNIVLNLLLIPPLGMPGAAVATMTSTVVWNFLLFYIVRKKLGLDPSLVSIRSLFSKT